MIYSSQKYIHIVIALIATTYLTYGVYMQKHIREFILTRVKRSQ